jgi:hypothetical protein
MNMKKNFFYFAMALCVALCTVSCGSDDDGDSAPSYTPQKYEKEAAAFTLEDRTASNVIGSGEIISITGINFTESGKAIFETTHWKSGKTNIRYSTYDYEINDNKYVVKDGNKEIGTIVNKSTRADGDEVLLEINLTLTFNGTPVSYIFDNPKAAIQLIEKTAKTNITRTWTIDFMILTLDFGNKPDATTTVQGGSLKDFLKLAKEQELNLTAKDEEALNREIVGVTLDKFGLFTIDYKDNFNDAASWSWDVAEKTIKIKLKNEEEMGHKFLNDNVKIDIKYIGNNKVAMALTAILPDDDCTATLLMNLK